MHFVAAHTEKVGVDKLMRESVPVMWESYIIMLAFESLI